MKTAKCIAMALNKLLRRHLNYARPFMTYKEREGDAGGYLPPAAKKHPEVYNKITATKDWSKNFWESLHKTLHQENVKENMISSTIIRLCLTSKSTDAAMFYIRFLKDNNYDISPPIMMKHLELYAIKDTLTESEKSDVLQIYETLMQQCSHWNEEARTVFVRVISRTNRWKESCQILDTITKFKAVGAHASVIAAAFNHDRADIGWKYLQKCPSSLTIHKCMVLRSYLEYCSRDKENFDGNMENMFQYVREQHIYFGQDAVDDYIKTCNKFGWLAQYSKMTSGKCEQCSKRLSNSGVTEEEFQLLHDAFTQTAVFSHDVYCHSTPEELETFKKFLIENKPFDIVIDGLNITYYKKNSIGDSLETAVKYFTKQNKTVLIIARHHMHKKFKQMFGTNPFISMFLVNNITQDDVFVLHATLKSGYKCAFVSLDLMRQHKFKLQDEHLKNIFIKWQLSRQYRVTDNGNNIFLISPQKFERIAQKTDNCWHIPFTDQDTVSYEFPRQWICFNMKPNSNLINC